MRSTRSRFLAALAAPLLVVALAGCGGDTSGDATSDGGGDASAASSGYQPGDEVDVDEFLGQMKSGVESSTTATIGMKMSASGIEISADGQVDYTTTPPSMAMKMTMPMLGDEPIDIRLVDGKVYMNMGAMSQGKFIAADLDDPNSPLGDLSSMTDSFDPVSSFEKFKDGIDKVVFVGDETLDGDDVSHFTATLDSSKISDALAGLNAGAGTADLPKTLEYDLWTDSDNRVRKVSMEMGDLATLEMTTSNWGEDVTIEAPPSDQITDMASLGGGSAS
ncbi:MAG: LppX_LprAFG lipoprotein [Nocardioidaceae bacterium]